MLDGLTDFVVHPLTFVSVLTNHHNEGLSPTNADAEVAGNDGIRMMLVVIVLLLHRAVAGIATMILKILLEGIQLFLVLAVMTDKYVVQVCHII